MEMHMFSDHFLLLLPLLALILAAATAAAKRAKPVANQNLPPGPYSWPILGNLPHMLKGPHIYLTELSRRYGPLCSVKLGTHLFVIGSSPVAATEIMRAHERLPTYRWVPKAGQNGLQELSLIWATECTQHWKLLRSLCKTELFSAKGLDSQTFIREKHVTEMVRFLKRKQGKVVDIRELVFASTVNILGDICFSRNFVGLERGEKESRGLKRALCRLMRLGTRPNVVDFYPGFEGWDPQGLKKKTSEAMGEAFGVWEEVIRERREGRKVGGSDFLDAMLGCGFSDLQINQLTVVTYLLLFLYFNQN